MSGDVGLFGPDSVTWKVHKEPIVSLGGLRSLYLQALHPRAVAAVAQNSSYRSDPWGRLNRTSEYVVTVLYGTTAEVERRFRSRYGPSQELYFNTVRPTDRADIVVYNDKPHSPAWETRPR